MRLYKLVTLHIVIDHECIITNLDLYSGWLVNITHNMD
jgi:hypothetical protein